MEKPFSFIQQIHRLESRLDSTMLRDRDGFRRRLHGLLKDRSGDRFRRLKLLESKLEVSIKESRNRLAGVPRITYPENLPITAKRTEIIERIRANQVLIISGETGCGKSTQIPKMCLDAGGGIHGKIGCTQPRRIAATSIARRIAEEMGEELGRSVGYKIRFTDKTSRSGYIKVMTDGILLAETQGDRSLLDYDTLIIDEAHERSLNIDFLLGILKTLLPQRPDLKVIISSATLETEKFSAAFGNAPVIVVKGRTFPVEVEYLPVDPDLEEEGEITYVDMALKAVDMLRARRRRGDALIFMPTEQDVLETCERLEGRTIPGTTILPLYARLPAAQQGRVYSVNTSKIVVATNVAETSLTIPGIKYVIDTGLARVATYHPRTRTRNLPITPISRASADQRKGRCGRVQEGVCIRLFSEDDYLARPAFTPPEILRSNLAEVILRMLYLGLGHPASFPFLDTPSERSIKDGFDLLVELGAIIRKDKGYELTETGTVMARTPLDPRISRMMVEASREGCMEEVAVIAAGLSIQDPRERPADKAKQSDQMTGVFRDPDSDFLTLFNIWRRYHREWESLKTQNRMRRFCKEHFLSFSRMREWVYTHEQILSILRERTILQTKPGVVSRKHLEQDVISNPARSRGGRDDNLVSRGPASPPDNLYGPIHKSILSGFLSNIALKKEKNIFLAARGREVMVFPGSTLFNRNVAWIVAAEMVKTSRLFARTAARIEPEWLEPLAGDFCKYSYSEPHWEKNPGEVRAFQQVTLFGLPIVTRRPVSYGPLAPEKAHEIFVRSALVKGDLKEKPAFLQHNRELLESLASIEDKLRRRDIVAGDERLEEFYSARLQGVYDTAGLEKEIARRGSDRFLRLREDDLLLFRPDETMLSLYPDRMALGDKVFDCTYRFAPLKPEDGATVRIPAGLISRIETGSIDWGVPGLLREKITALIKGLPKRYRKQLVPVSGTVEKIMAELELEERPLLNVLSELVFRRFGVDVPASVWASVELPEYLRMRVSIVDHKGREIQSGRDIGVLKAAEAKAPGSDSNAWKKARETWEKSGLTSWDFDELPETVQLHDHLLAYPGLEPAELGVNIRLFQSLRQALDSHVRGVETLMSLHLAKDLKFLKRNLALTRESAEDARYFGGSSPVEKDLFDALKKALFRKNVRSRESFEKEMIRARSEMAGLAVQLRDKAAKVLHAYFQARQAIYAIESAHKGNHAILALCSEVRTMLDALIPEHFLLLYPSERLLHLPRYIRALQIRAERGANDPAKDSSKTAQAGKLLHSLKKLSDELGPGASQQKRDAVEELRWMVEEFKVSLFAQELKTPFPVSAKRVEEKVREIERMI
ncbi:MAG: ATP-dependent RNA helicase HrpA [Deltaproteobacteria bacterium HGW-Deltaproteobacteria-21]|nr:MAG: ATP-dependent RNA helicase HrpA [Deltaproteobacteria bacterium HGW-Deltaproteobacteria-21]